MNNFETRMFCNKDEELTVTNEMERQVAASVFELNFACGTTGYRIDSSVQKNPRRNGLPVFSISTIIIPTTVTKGIRDI